MKNIIPIKNTAKTPIPYNDDMRFSLLNTISIKDLFGVRKRIANTIQVPATIQLSILLLTLKSQK